MMLRARRLSIAGIAAAGLLLASAPAVAASQHWTALGPFGGFAFTLTAVPTQPARLYATFGPQGAFGSEDGGLSWRLLHPGSVNGNIVADPAHPAVLYMAGGPGNLLKSTDGGAHWLPANRGLEHLSSGMTLAIAPGPPSRLYLGNNQGVWRSDDGARSWQQVNRGLPSQILVLSLAVPSRPTGMVLAGTPSGLFWTVNAGARWRSPRGLPRGSVTAVAFSPSDPRTAYAAFADRRVYRSLDGGATWAPAGAPFASPVSSLAVSSSAVYAGTQGRLFRSADGGAHWRQAFPSRIGILGLATAGRTVYASIALDVLDLNGVMASSDEGATWQRRNHGLAGVPSFALAVPSGNADALWSGLEQGLYHSADAGRHWAASPLPAIPPARQPVPRDLAFAADGAALYAVLDDASGNRSLWKTADGGASWDPLSPPQFLSRVWTDPADAASLYAGVATSVSGGISASHDGGATWSAQAPDSPCGFRGLAVAGARLYGVTTGGEDSFLCPRHPAAPAFFRSLDAGATWTAGAAGLPATPLAAVAVDPVDSSRVYLGAGEPGFEGGRGVWKSTDAGATWSPAGTETDGLAVAALAVSATGTVWAATGATTAEGSRIFRSADAGASWEDRTGDFQQGTVTRLVAAGDRVYVANDGGVWMTDDTP